LQRPNPGVEPGANIVHVGRGLEEPVEGLDGVVQNIEVHPEASGVVEIIIVI
jgi:hypothetical protein